MKENCIAFLVALSISLCLVPVARRLALKLGFVENISARKVHRTAIPRVGGISIVVAFFTPLAICLLWIGPFQEQLADLMCSHRLLGLFLGGAVIATVGFIDDVRGLSAKTKLAFEVGVAIALWFLDYRIEAVTNPVTGQPIVLGIFALPITVCWIVGIINAINLIDGLDGLASGVSLIATVALFVLAATTGNLLMTLTMACFAGALLGFLVFNFHPARIFMGDSGSMFIGFVIATASIAAGTKSSAIVALSVPCLALGLPIMDTFLAIFRRIARKAPIFSADREHVHHKLLDMGFGQRKVVFMLYGMTTLFTGLAILISTQRGWISALSLVVFAVVVLSLTRFMGYLDLFATLLARARQPSSAITRRIRSSLPLLFSSDHHTLDGYLSAFGLAADLHEIEIFLDNDDGTLERPILWKRPLHRVQADEGCRVSLALRPWSDTNTTLRITWFSQCLQVQPNEEVLLQVVTDQICRLIESGLPVADLRHAAIATVGGNTSAKKIEARTSAV